MLRTVKNKLQESTDTVCALDVTEILLKTVRKLNNQYNDKIVEFEDLSILKAFADDKNQLSSFQRIKFYL